MLNISFSRVYFSKFSVRLPLNFSFQERKLVKYDQQENEAPLMVQRLGEEAHALREQLKRSKEKCDSRTRKLQEVSEELDRTQRLLKKMKSLVDDKKLVERDELTRRLEKATSDNEEKKQTITVRVLL